MLTSIAKRHWSCLTLQLQLLYLVFFCCIFSQFLLFFQCCIQSTLTDTLTHTHKSHCNCKKLYLLATCTRTHKHPYTHTLSRRHKQLIEQIYFLLLVLLLVVTVCLYPSLFSCDQQLLASCELVCTLFILLRP